MQAAGSAPTGLLEDCWHFAGVTVPSCCSSLGACAGRQQAAPASRCCRNSMLLLDVPGEHSVCF